MKPILLIIKVDRLIAEVKLSPLEAYHHLVKVLEQVKADAALGRQLNVQATPTFFINGIKINGGMRPVFFEAMIERELKRAGAVS